MKRLMTLAVALLVVGLLGVQCAPAPTPEVIEKEVVVEKSVVETVIVEKEVVVEKSVVETVIVEKEKVVEKVVTATPPPPPAGKGSLVFALDSGILGGLDATQTLDTTSKKVAFQLSETLVEFDWDKNDVVPKLAESWQVADNFQSVTLNLRQGVTFHDGTPFNADAVIFNFERVFNKDSEYHDMGNYPYAGFLAAYESSEKIDDYTVKINLSTPEVTVMWRLSLEGTYIQSPAAVKRFGEDYTNNPVGTGPFKLVEYDPSVKIVLERYEDYWGPKPDVEKLIFVFIPDDQAKVAELMAGNVDIITRVPPELMPMLEAAGFKTYKFPTAVAGYVNFNTIRWPTDDLIIRKAITYALDRERICNVIRLGSGKPVYGQWFEGFYAYEPNVPRYEFDLDKARQVLDDAGYVDTDGDGIREKDGKPLSFRLLDREDTAHGGGTGVHLLIQNNLKKIGMDMELIMTEHALKYTEQGVFNPDNFEVAIGGIACVLPDPSIYFQRLHSRTIPPNGFNVSFYDNPELDALLDEGDRTVDSERRVEIFKQVQRLVAEELPWLLYEQSNFLVATTDRVENFRVVGPWKAFIAQVELKD